MSVASAPEVSVVIVSWNTRELLLDAIRSYWDTCSVSHELVVVDNASRDGSAEAVEAAFPSARVIRNPRNVGFGAGVNVGLRAARAPFVLLLNTDTLVRGDAIGALVGYARAHPEAAIVGPRVLNTDGSLQSSIFRFPSLLNLLLAVTYLYKLAPGSARLNRERYGGQDRARPCAVDVVSGCCFLIRREVLDEIGLLDEDYFMYAEETDLCYRAHAAHREVHYAPVGEIVHFGGGSTRQVSERMLLEMRRSILRFFTKHYGRTSAEVARVLLLGFLLVRLPLWWALAAAGREGARARASAYASAARFLLRPIPALLAERPALGR